MKLKEEKDKNGFKTKDGFIFPLWMECSWRRKSCNKKGCKLCGRILRDRQKHIKKGENPDDMKSILEDVGNSFLETKKMLKEGAKKWGIEIDDLNYDDVQLPPKPQAFPLYKKVDKWRKNIFDLADDAEKYGDLWIFTEAAADLFWYCNTLSAKTYRQLCNKWEIKNGDEYGSYDFEYTRYVLIQCIKILKSSLNNLSLLNSNQKGELMILLSELNKLEKQILMI